MKKLSTTVRNGFFIMITMCLFALTSPAQAVTLNVVNGQLQGASGLNVDGKIFDVEFLNGSCVSLFERCDAVSDFAFQTRESAVLAGQVLLASVFINGSSGNFDDDPKLTNDIENLNKATLLIPYAFDPNVGQVIFVGVENFNTQGLDTVISVLVGPATFGTAKACCV